MNNPEIRLTKDGSHTLWLPGLQETYHSFHGAITESQHVFIDHGLQHFLQITGASEVNILEVGFGTGLNALLTCYHSQEKKQRIKYTSLEPNPLDPELTSQLNYASCLDHPQIDFWFRELHKIMWGQIEWLNPYFSILKLKEPIQEHTTPDQYDICFFDAFAPGKQPEIWELSVLETVKRGLKRPGMVVSYCAQGQFKRNLMQLGFIVEALPGPPGKKEMTRATIDG
jgi:tRNA U34 5-methylaminomethyl-2-thiouridine-forming methyltransferase MnmC